MKNKQSDCYSCICHGRTAHSSATTGQSSTEDAVLCCHGSLWALIAALITTGIAFITPFLPLVGRFCTLALLFIVVILFLRRWAPHKADKSPESRCGKTWDARMIALVVCAVPCFAILFYSEPVVQLTWRERVAVLAPASPPPPAAVSRLGWVDSFAAGSSLDNSSAIALKLSTFIGRAETGCHLLPVVDDAAQSSGVWQLCCLHISSCRLAAAAVNSALLDTAPITAALDTANERAVLLLEPFQLRMDAWDFWTKFMVVLSVVAWWIYRAGAQVAVQVRTAVGSMSSKRQQQQAGDEKSSVELGSV
eukprot:PLAT12844.1.p1 GENE.PLAT12844.1~~PLAT12844.1.p1  ORF type:complete len:307 (+),score=52.98 PLAT12844.1:3-923(+)